MTPTSSRGGWVVSGRGAEQQELIVHDAMTPRRHDHCDQRH